MLPYDSALKSLSASGLKYRGRKGISPFSIVYDHQHFQASLSLCLNHSTHKIRSGGDFPGGPVFGTLQGGMGISSIPGWVARISHLAAKRPKCKIEAML